jgi:hypothetical protein
VGASDVDVPSPDAWLSLATSVVASCGSVEKAEKSSVHAVRPSIAIDAKTARAILLFTAHLAGR